MLGLQPSLDAPNQQQQLVARPPTERIQRPKLTVSDGSVPEERGFSPTQLAVVQAAPGWDLEGHWGEAYNCLGAERYTVLPEQELITGAAKLVVKRRNKLVNRLKMEETITTFDTRLKPVARTGM